MESIISKRDIMQRLASLGLIIGGLVTAVGNLLHPRGNHRTLEDVQPLLEIINRAGIVYWKLDHFFLTVGIWLLGVGWLGIRRQVASTPGEPFATIGFYGIVVATALWTAIFVMDMNVGLVAMRWHDAVGEPAKAMWVSAASAVSSLSFETDAMAQIVQWLCFILFGIGMVRSKLYPAWVGWAGIVLGTAFLPLAALPQYFNGPSDLVTNHLFPGLATLSILWLITIGVRTARRAW